MDNYQNYIEINPNKRSGKPCIKGTRIAVSDILDMFADSMTIPEICSDYPYLDEVKIKAALTYAAEKEKQGKVA